ncbi:hypothetical protein ACFX10_040641 [Malus domestica]
MHKILVAKFMHIDQDGIKCVKEVEVVLMAQLRSATEKIEKLESELTVLSRCLRALDFYGIRSTLSGPS